MDGQLDQLAARVEDLESCLAGICERLATFARAYPGNGRSVPTAAALAQVLADLAEVIKACPLNA